MIQRHWAGNDGETAAVESGVQGVERGGIYATADERGFKTGVAVVSRDLGCGEWGFAEQRLGVGAAFAGDEPVGVFAGFG